MIFFAIGIALMTFGAFTGIENISSAQNDKRLLSQGTKAVGEVVNIQLDIRTGRGSSSQKIFTVEYTDLNGNAQSLIESEVYRSKEEGSLENVSNEWLHKNVNVFYDATDPSNSVVDGWQDSTSMAVFGCVFLELTGSALIVFTIFDVRKSLSPSRNNS